MTHEQAKKIPEMIQGFKDKKITVCDVCKHEWAMQIDDIRQRNLTEGIEWTYLRCPKCGQTYTIVLTNSEIRGLQVGYHKRIELLKFEIKCLNAKGKRIDKRKREKLNTEQEELKTLFQSIGVKIEALAKEYEGSLPNNESDNIRECRTSEVTG